MATKRCTEADRRGRPAKARQFLEALADEDDLLDALVTLCAHAGIAGADVVCCARLGEHATGQNRTDEAVELLAGRQEAGSRPVEAARDEDPCWLPGGARDDLRSTSSSRSSWHAGHRDALTWERGSSVTTAFAESG